MSAFTKIAIQGPGLKKQGILVLQTLFIGLFTFLELRFRGGAGTITGITILACFFTGIRFGRPGSTYVAVVTPPLAFAGTALIWILLLDGFKPSRIGIDFIGALASQAPYLIIGSLYGWFVFLNAKAKKRPSKPRS